LPALVYYVSIALGTCMLQRASQHWLACAAKDL